MYRVAWFRSALNQLTAVWLASDSSLREEITGATHELDRELRIDPLSIGESRTEKS